MAHRVINLTKEQIQSAIQSTTSMRKASILLGVKLDSFRRYAKEYGLYSPARTPERKTMTREFVNDCVSRSSNMAEAALLSGRHYKAFERHAKAYGLWKPNIRHRSPVKYHNRNRIPLEDILCGKHPTYSAGALKARLIKSRTLELKCEICDLTQWQGQPAPLQMDHIDGNRTNHRLENLRLLCPNCHALTPTFCGRNIKH